MENLIRIQLRGLEGPITVKGVEYRFPAAMPAMAYQTDEQIAAVLSFVRSSFGNSAPPVSPLQVAALRSEAGQPPLLAVTLIAPEPPASPAPSGNNRYDNLHRESAFPLWIWPALILIVVTGAGAWLRRGK